MTRPREFYVLSRSGEHGFEMLVQPERLGTIKRCIKEPGDRIIKVREVRAKKKRKKK